MAEWTAVNVSAYRASADVQNVAGSVFLTLFLVILFGLALFFNVLFIFVYCRVRHIRRPYNYLLLNITLIDLLATLLWIVPSIVAAAAWRWLFGDAFCAMHSFMCTLIISLTTHTFVAVAFEKFLRFWWPSKHTLLFHKKIVIILLLGIWCFDIVIAALPLMGWGKALFFTYQFQCSIDFEKSLSHLNFSFVILFAVPFALSAVLYAVAAIYIRRRLRQITPARKDVLQVDKSVRHESYATRLSKQQKKVQDHKYIEKTKKKKKKTQNGDEKPGNEVEDAYAQAYGSSSDSSSSEEELPEYVDDYIPRYKREHNRKKRKRKRIYVYKRRHYLMTLATFVAWLVYMLLWLPYWIISYHWALNYWYPPSWALYSFFTLLTFFGVPVKVFIYGLFNRKLVKAMWEAFCGKKKEEKPKPKLKPEEKTVIYTTQTRSNEPPELPVYATTFRYMDDD